MSNPVREVSKDPTTFTAGTIFEAPLNEVR
jgi:hypothetical protein